MTKQFIYTERQTRSAPYLTSTVLICLSFLFSISLVSAQQNVSNSLCLSMGAIAQATNNLSFGGIVCNSNNCLVAPVNGTITRVYGSWRQTGGAIIAGNQGNFTVNLTVNGVSKYGVFIPYVDNGYLGIFINDSLNIPYSLYDNISVSYTRVNGTFSIGFPSYCISMLYLDNSLSNGQSSDDNSRFNALYAIMFLVFLVLIYLGYSVDSWFMVLAGVLMTFIGLLFVNVGYPGFVDSSMKEPLSLIAIFLGVGIMAVSVVNKIGGEI